MQLKEYKGQANAIQSSSFPWISLLFGRCSGNPDLCGLHLFALPESWSARLVVSLRSFPLFSVLQYLSRLSQIRTYLGSNLHRKLRYLHCSLVGLVNPLRASNASGCHLDRIGNPESQIPRSLFKASKPLSGIAIF